MKLCAGILYWGLKEELKTVELHGAGSQELTLSRPEFYLDRTKTFERNRVYVCSADHLPARPSLSANVCLVCLGQHWNLNGFYDRCSVIVVEADTDIFRVFNLVQHIFDRYEAWEERLWHILRHGASLPQMLEVSRGIFENPMLLIGSDFRYLAVTDEEYFQKDLGIRLDTETFDAEKMATFLSLHDLSTHVHDPLLLELQGIRTLSVNVFDQEEYLGCLTVFEAFRPLQDFDRALSIFLAKLLRQAVQQNPTLASTRSAVRRALRSVIAGQPVDFELRRALSQENGKTDWVCVRLQPKRGAAARWPLSTSVPSPHFYPPHRPNVRQRRSSCRCWTDSAWSAAYPVCFPICMRQIRHGSRLPAPCRTAFCRMETARSFIFRTICCRSFCPVRCQGDPRGSIIRTG